MLSFYNYTWKTLVSANWKKAIIIPVLKKDTSLDDFSNYRPISLTSYIAKTMEKMISGDRKSVV